MVCKYRDNFHVKNEYHCHCTAKENAPKDFSCNIIFNEWTDRGFGHAKIEDGITGSGVFKVDWVKYILLKKHLVLIKELQ